MSCQNCNYYLGHEPMCPHGLADEVGNLKLEIAALKTTVAEQSKKLSELCGETSDLKSMIAAMKRRISPWG